LTGEGLKIKVRAEKATQPARLGHFQIEVSTPELDPHHQAGILRAVKSCSIHNALLNPPAIEIALNAPVETTIA